jgi:hypothetical protein
MTPLCRRQCRIRQDLVQRVAACHSEVGAAFERKRAAGLNHDIEEWKKGDVALIDAHERRDQALEELVAFDSEISIQTYARLTKIREALEEGVQLIEERATLMELWQHPSEGETPCEAVEGEITSIDRNVVFESRRTIKAGLAALEEMDDPKLGPIPSVGDSWETPPLGGFGEEAVTNKEAN